MGRIAAKLREEIEAMIPPTIFFFVVLHILAVVRSLMLRGAGIPASTTVSVAVASLVLGKVVLIADMLPFINRYPDKPLMFNVVWKTAIYTLVSVVVHYVEHLVDYWRETGSLPAANRTLFAHIVWPHFFAIQILLVVMIFSYCVIRELIRVLGKRRAMEIFFGTNWGRGPDELSS